MQERLNEIRKEATGLIDEAEDEEALNAIRVKYLGRKGILTQILKGVGKLPPEERPLVGKLANQYKKEIEQAIKARKEALLQKTKGRRRGLVDLTLPGRALSQASPHPITQVMREIIDCFTRMGFSVATGPEIELDFFNFEALNIPPEHPARDMQDTFYISDDTLLRTHTSPIQIRTMKANEPPLRIIAPGKVYRCDSDVTHTPMFHQVEGLLVDEDVSFAHLKGILTAFAQSIFHPDTKLRFRPSFFPFTEPSAEVDIQCVICRGSGCRVCSDTGWIEVLGCGLVHPQVFRNVGYDTERFTGFAFGLGVERITMLKYGINDLRLFFENDIRFLRQF